MSESHQTQSSVPNSTQPHSRRDFLANATAAATVATLAIALPVLAAADANDDPNAGADQPVKTKKKTDFSADGLFGDWIKDNHFLVVRENHRIYALTSICPHRGCDVAVLNNTQILCHCHGSEFSDTGAVTHGPAHKALAHLGISVDADGVVVVDPRQHFAETQWDDPASFIALDPTP